MKETVKKSKRKRKYSFFHQIKIFSPVHTCGLPTIVNLSSELETAEVDIVDK